MKFFSDCSQKWEGRDKHNDSVDCDYCRCCTFLSAYGDSACGDRCYTCTRARLVIHTLYALDQFSYDGKDGSERQIIKDMDGNLKRPKIRYCSISDPFILILREDDSLGLFVGNAETGKIRRKDMTPLGEKVKEKIVIGAAKADDSSVLRSPVTLAAAFYLILAASFIWIRPIMPLRQTEIRAKPTM